MVPFILAVKKGASDGNFKAFDIRGVASLDVSALADDMAVFLSIDETSFREFFHLLDRFQLASGAKVNLRKSKIMLLGRYRKPPDWINELPLQLLGRTQPTRKSHIKTIRCLFRSFLWGFSSGGKTKTPLISWDLISAPLLAGGLGLWDLPTFNQAFLCKFVGALLTSPLDAPWPDLFWGLSRDLVCRSREEFLLFADLQTQSSGPLFRRMCDAWSWLRNDMVWSPPLLSIPLSMSVDSAIWLLFRGGALSLP
ncbi:hypothetical protein R1sor_023853 [Riccia sorocarpa]|uniref:Reverse transcriptase domain-containing protein n=1 Tax=Riccia sorocarpa TaxID=122646 RepID=A0ABD3GNV9_9MARC